MSAVRCEDKKRLTYRLYVCRDGGSCGEIEERKRKKSQPGD